MFNKCQTPVYRFLGNETQLIVGHFIHKILQSLLFIVDASHIKVNCLKYLIVGDTTFDNVVFFIIITSFATAAHEVQPFLIIGIEYLYSQFRIWSILENMHIGILSGS